MGKLILVSVDSHAQVPAHAWPDFLEKRYHAYLPSLYEENEVYPTVMGRLAHRMHLRGGYLKPAEGAGKLHLIEPLLMEDLEHTGVSPSAARVLS